ncbi:MAG: DivIVA domain-containing protein [Chloroflexaceae bacterium]|nr:DivIVA domain-containing protein [Chloroflexaceae bacterium]
MLRKKVSPPSANNGNHAEPSLSPPQAPAVDLDIHKEFNRVEEIVLDSPRVPFTRLTLLDEDRLLNQLDFVRLNLPEAFEKALSIIQQQEQIISQAEAYAEKLVQTAQNRAAQMLDEMAIVRRAEQEAGQVRQQIQRECEVIQQKTLAEIEQLRRAARQELEQMRQQTLAECTEIQRGADEYADAVLARIEQQLREMMQIIYNGRQQLRGNSAATNQQTH